MEEKVQEAPKKRAKKPQSYDRKGQPHYKQVSEAANTGRKAALLAMGMEPKSVSPFPNPEFESDADSEEDVTTDPSEAAAIQLARQQTQAL